MTAKNAKSKTVAAATTEVAAQDLALLEALEAPPAAPTIEELESIEAQAQIMASYEAQAAPAQAANEAQAPAADPAVSFQEIFENVSDGTVHAMIAAFTNSFAERARFEHEANPTNSNIQKTLSKELAGHSAFGMAKGLAAIGVSAEYLNDMETSAKRRNVYTLGKLRDLVSAVLGGRINNAINRAVMISLVRLHDQQLAFTQQTAKECASDKIALSNLAAAPYMTRHTVAEGTADTQANSTMKALEILGVVENKGTKRGREFVLTDTPFSKAMVSMVRRVYLGQPV